MTGEAVPDLDRVIGRDGGEWSDLLRVLDLVRAGLGVSSALVSSADGIVSAGGYDGQAEAELIAIASCAPPGAACGPSARDVETPSASGARLSCPSVLGFHAAAPLIADNGRQLGMLWIGDRSRRPLDAEASRELRDYAALAASILRQRENAGALSAAREQIREGQRIIQDQAKSLAHSRKIFQRSSEAAKIGVWECDLPGETLTWTDGVYDIFELPRGTPVTREQILAFYSAESRQTLGVLRSQAIRERSGFTLDTRITTAKGNKRWMRITASVECEEGEPVRIFGMKQDITAERTLQDKMRFLAECDVLTGLANRSRLRGELANFEQRIQADGAGAALLLIDLDGFKQVNDNFGHASGDECLIEIAARLRALCGADDIIARMGGDEFAVLTGLGGEQAIDLAGRIVAEARRPIRCEGQSFQLGASVGVAFLTAEAGASTDVFVDADLALYAAKAAGRNTLRVFDPAMRAVENNRLRTIRNLTAAHADGELEVFYQPIIALHEGRIAGFEALLRWRRSDGTMVEAGAFAAAFDDPELSRSLGDWVMETALCQAGRWHKAGVPFGSLALNVSAAQLLAAGFAERLICTIGEHGLLPQSVVIEVTEGAFHQSKTGAIQEIVQRIRSAGVRVALDDFGTGQASLVQLRHYPVDTIKIDTSFVRDFLHSPQDRTILEAIIHLASGFGLNVVAEGVESLEQCEHLTALGFAMAQGYVFARPLPAASVEPFLAQQGGRLARVA